MKIPIEIQSYLSNNELDEKGIYFLELQSTGEVMSLGNSADLLIATPVIGDKIDQYLPVLVGVFPVVNSFNLPNIQLRHGQFFDIHILKKEDSVWIILKEVSKKIEHLITQIAQNNELTKTQFQLLEALEYLVFKKNENGIFIPISEFPYWVSELEDSHINFEEVEIEDVFPFLSFFVDSCKQTQISEVSKQTYSGIWTQSKVNGEEIHLNAWSFQVLDDAYILIHSVDFGYNTQNNIIQLARENSLAYEQLQKTKQELQDLLILKDKFVSIVSHDFRSPLSSIYDGLSFLVKDLKNDEKFDSDNFEIVQQVQKEVVRLLDYNDKLYNWTKMNLNTIETHKVDVDLVLLMSDFEQNFEKRLQEKNLRLNVEIVDDVIVCTDEVLLNQVISNIMDNAIKFSQEGASIDLILNHEYLEIKDYGVGIPEPKIEEIIKGYSLKSTNGTKGEVGTGLGLNIVTRIINELNFRLDIKSIEGEGTSFRIIFA